MIGEEANFGGSCGVAGGEGREWQRQPYGGYHTLLPCAVLCDGGNRSFASPALPRHGPNDNKAGFHSSSPKAYLLEMRCFVSGSGWFVGTQDGAWGTAGLGNGGRKMDRRQRSR